MFRSFFKYIARFLECFFGFLFTYLIIVLFFQSIKIGSLDQNGEITLYVRSNGVHTDVCFPSQTELFNWNEFVPLEDYPKNDAFDFITIGWGDKGFFLDTPTWAELKTSTALNAVFLPSSTAMHVAYSKEPAISENCIPVKVSSVNYMKMIEFVQSTFENHHAKIQLIKGKGYSINDNFYEANGSYHLFRTCNSWTNDVLRKGNVHTSLYAFFPDGIMEGLDGEK